MKVKYLTIIFLYIFSLTDAYAQRMVRELESNVSQQQFQDKDSVNGKKMTPTEVYAWCIDEIFGNATPTHVDTLRHAYQNNSLSEGMRGEYNTLGNLGAPRQSRLFMEREENNNFIFVNPLSQFYVPTNKFLHYNTKSPYMNVSYNFCGSKQTGYDNLRVIYTQNIGKRTNLGASYSYLYGQGYYANENTSLMNTSVWASHKSDRYDMHFYYQYNFLKMAENGGITDEAYITRPEEQAIKIASNDIPTNLSNTWNRQEHHIVFLNHHYNIGFEKTEGDSTNITYTFVPVMRFFHTLKLANNFRNYRSFRNESNFYQRQFLAIADTVNDNTTNFTIRNNLGVSLCEGFQKWAAFGLNAYIGFESRNYWLPDTITEEPMAGRGWITRRKFHEYDLVVGGQLIRSKAKIIKYNVDAEFVLAGENLGQFTVSGHGEANIPFLKDTLQIAANAYIKNLNPSFYYRHFHSTYAWWDQNTQKEMRQRIQGVLTYPKTKTKLTVGLENIKNFAYFANQGIRSEGKVNNNPVALQCSDNIQVFSINLDQKVKLGPLHFDNDITYQTTSNATVLPLPALSTYTNLYLDFKIAKVLKTEFGADMKFFTEYKAPTYSPIIGQFITQHPDDVVKIGKHPLISAYINFELKRLRFYVQYYHANAGNARAFWAPYYPMSPTGLHFGLSWNFYD